jgi:hypothetical protein
MDGGAALDSGSVSELLERQPLFAELWQRCAGAEAMAARAA